MADSYIGDLTEDTTPTGDDLIETEHDPAGTPVSRKVKILNLLKRIFLSDNTQLTFGAVTDGQFLKRDGTNIIGATPAAGGDASGPSSATDNAIARFDGTTGKLLQNSVVVVSDAGVITLPEVAAPSTPAAGTVHIYAKSDGHLYIKDDAGTETDLTGGGGGAIAPLQLTDANTVEQHNGTTNQVHRLHATRTSSTNYEAFKTYFDSGNGAFRLEAEKGSGGGSFRNIFIVVSGGIFQFTANAFVPPGDDTTNLGSGSNYWNEIFGDHHILRNSNSRVRWAGSTRLIAPANGVLNIKDDSENGGSGTLRFDNRTPSTITSNQDNYSIPVPGYFVRLATDASRNITGIVVGGGQGDGQIHLLVNVGSFDIVIKHQDAASTATNRFLNSTGADITLTSNQAAEMIYDGTTQRWRVFKRN
jgi:hypothetical protein